MDAEPLRRLTEAQKTCLRMVFMHMSSKDIARELGISPHTVDQRLKTAARILGADSRVEAARMLALHEGGGTYRPLVYQPPDIAAAGLAAALSAQVDREGAKGLRDGAMREDQAAFLAYDGPRSALPLPLPIRGARPDDLTPWHRLGWTLAIMIAIALTFGVFVTGVEALSRLAGR